jgi:hypothetical protein
VAPSAIFDALPQWEIGAGQRKAPRNDPERPVRNANRHGSVRATVKTQEWPQVNDTRATAVEPLVQIELTRPTSVIHH